MYRHRPYRSKIRFLEYLPDGRLLSVGGAARSVWIWEPGARQPSRKLPSTSGILALNVSSNGRLIAARTANSRIPIWEEATGKLLSQMIWHAPAESELAFVPNTTQLCVASWNGVGEYDDPTLTSVEFRRSDRIWAVNSAHYLSMTISPAGRWMISTLATSGGLALEDIALFDRHQSTRTTRPTGVRSLGKVRFFHAEELVYCTQLNGPNLWIWSLHPWEMRQALLGHKAPINTMVCSPDGRHLLTGSGDGTVIVWDLPSGQLLRQYDWGLGAITALAIAPDGLTWSVGGERGELLTCDLE